MKTLITASIIALSSANVAAFDLSEIDPQEYYSGQNTSHEVVIDPALAAARHELLFDEGKFPQALPGSSTSHDRGIADIDFPEELYMDGHWPI